jgi:hypothetical protein
VRDFVILEMKSNPATCQGALGCHKVLTIGSHGEVEHAYRFARERIRLIASGGKKRESSLIACDKHWNALPHSLKAAFKTKDLDVPIGRAFNIPNSQRHVIESFQLKHCGQ